MVERSEKVKNGYATKPVLGIESANREFVIEYPQAGLCMKVATGIKTPTVSLM